MADTQQGEAQASLIQESLTPESLIPLGQWQAPAATVQRTLREALSALFGYVREAFRGSTSTFEVEPDIESLSPYQLRRFAPEPDRQWRAERLGASLDQHWEQNGGGAPGSVTCLVSPPHSGIAQSLAIIAEARQWRVIQPPEDLLLTIPEAEAWWDEQALEEGPWVIPELARFWLRHRSGLALLTVLFGRLSVTPRNPGLIGCSSWCWNFWVRYLPGLSLVPQTLPAMTSDKLDVWLAALPGNRPTSALRVRKTNNGHWVMTGGADINGGKRSDLLKDLSAMARGNPGVALAIWRKSLRAKPDESLPEDKEDEASASQPGDRQCWVFPLEQLTLPLVPSGATRDTTGVLHALLLHEGLDETALALVLPATQVGLRVVLQGLERSELIQRQDDRWQVSPLAYPSVRRTLLGSGYPVDGF
ncbi:hypothetical protein [Marinobacter zhejiangensis]|uniref:Uncharacterized protein n=1 Tax=Marinobacter zhejiangensis TaxID=488535 RepID=A0A1I4QFS5_9GAMM|nr:hypothetical protein [Marinobacter zhejiangensis]SFM38463.1 hypothetical protein SAMN04487963_2348 [Marinobacter zhejiangensis]